MYAMSGAVPAAIAVVTFGSRSPVDVPPELACTTMFLCVALKAAASLLITCDVGGVCAVQNWSVIFPDELFPEEPDPEHAARARVNAAVAAVATSAVRFMLFSLYRQPWPLPVIP